MSAPSAKPGIMDVPPTVYQPLPAVTEELHVVHYAAGPRLNGYAPTPPVAAIVVRHVLTGINMTFATFTEAEVAGVLADEFVGQLSHLEREMLSTFADFVTNRGPWGRRLAHGYGARNRRGGQQLIPNPIDP